MSVYVNQSLKNGASIFSFILFLEMQEEGERKDRTSYDDLAEKKQLIKPLIIFFVNQILAAIPRRITVRGKKEIKFTLKVPREVLVPWATAIDQYRTQKFSRVLFHKIPAGRGYKKLGSVTIKFFSLGGVQLHIGKRLQEKNIRHFFEKRFRQGGSGKCVITKESPLVMEYSISKGQLAFFCAYSLTNRAGFVC